MCLDALYSATVQIEQDIRRYSLASSSFFHFIFNRNISKQLNLIVSPQICCCCCWWWAFFIFLQDCDWQHTYIFDITWQPAYVAGCGQDYLTNLSVLGTFTCGHSLNLESGRWMDERMDVLTVGCSVSAQESTLHTLTSSYLNVQCCPDKRH